jgi:aminoglycoside phosphotransferase (APT) family kinase protein
VAADAERAPPPPDSSSTAGVTDRIETLKGILTELVIDLVPDESRNEAVKGYLARVVDWENQLYSRRASTDGDAADAPITGAAAFNTEAVERYLSTRFPTWRRVRVSNVRVVGGGFSKTTVMVDVDASDIPRHTLVIRAETEDSLLFYDGAQIDNEYRVQRLLYRSGIKVAEPLWLEIDTSPFGVRFLVSARAAGRNFGTAIQVNESLSEALLRDLMANLHALHQTPIDERDADVRDSHLAHWQQFRTLSESTAENVAYWRSNIAQLRLPPSPIIARAIGWLATHIPQSDEAPCLIHRDYGLHNVLIENDRISCILDWENATMGDPAEDLAWIANALAGTVERKKLLNLYAELRGRPISEERLRFFEVFISLKYAVTCLNALTLFERSVNAPVSLCEVGLKFMHHGTERLNRHIALAEQNLISVTRQGELVESHR